MQKSVDSVNRILREQITGVRVVRAFVREDVERERFAEANRTYTGTALAVGKLMALAFPVVMIIFNASTVAVLWFGAQRIDAGEMQIGSLTAFMSYLIQILMSVMMATFMAMMIPRATVSAGRIQEVLDTESSVHAPTDAVAIPAGPGRGRAARRHLRLPRGRVARAARGHAARRARDDHGDRGVDRGRQDDPDRPRPAAARRDVRAGPPRRRRRPRRRPRGPLVAHRHRPPAPLPLQRHRRVEPALRRPRRDRRRAVGGAAGRPGRGLRPRDARRARVAPSPRAAPTSAAASDSASPSPGPS